MSHENWSVGSHRTVERLMNGHRVAICEVYSGAADSLEQVDEFQYLIAAAPDMLFALQAIINLVDTPMDPCRKERTGLTVLKSARLAVAQATRSVYAAKEEGPAQ